MQIAVVGSGISGLASAWLLSRKHRVVLVERSARFGGHTNTVAVDGMNIDTGFIVYNETTYPLLVRLFDELGVATEPSDMSWSVRCDHCKLEYAGNAGGIFARRRNLVHPGHLRMVADIGRFNRLARQALETAETSTIHAFARRHQLSETFQRHYLLPMAAAIWSTGTAAIQSFPIATLARFFHNHGLLSMRGQLPWRTVTGGAASYIEPMLRQVSQFHSGDGVERILRDPDGVTLFTDRGATMRVDAVVLAGHADESLASLLDATPQEKELLGEWDYSVNRAVLHTDTTVMPSSRRAWASWNYHINDCTIDTDHVSLHYHMNRLQNLPTSAEYVVSLNSQQPVDSDAIRYTAEYTHPVYTTAAVDTQAELGELNGHNRTYFAGAYHRYGFHEDGLWSAVRVAGELGIPWPA